MCYIKCDKSDTSDNTLDVCTISDSESMDYDHPELTASNAHLFDGDGNYVGEQDDYEIIDIHSDDNIVLSETKHDKFITSNYGPAEDLQKDSDKQ
jgi:hypothetical protein